MTCKLVIFLILGVSLVQGYTLSQGDDNQLILIEETATSLFGKLEELIVNAIKAAKNTLVNLAEEFYTKVKEILAAATGKLTKLLSGLISELDALKEKAKKLGIDIADCITDEGNLTNLPKKYIPRIIDCGDNITLEGKLLIQRSIQSVEDTIQTVFDLKDKYSKCGSGWDSIVCKTKITYEISKAIVTVPLDILGIAAGTVPEVVSLYPKLQKCVLEETKSFLKEGRDIIRDIDECIESKIRPSSN